MPYANVNDIRMYYEEHGSGAPILLSHGTGSDADNWGDAPEELARLGRVIVYDRRGFSRSQLPEPYPRTTPGEHAADAAGLLHALGATPAIVVGRSYGGNVALELALRHPECVRALVLLEGGGEALSPEVGAFIDALTDQIRAAVAEGGLAAAGETLWRGVLGDTGYEVLPQGTKARVAANGAAVMAELEGFNDDQPSLSRLRQITCPALVVAAMESPPSFRQVSEELASALRNARLALVGGGHMITPTEPQVLRFIQEALAAAMVPDR